MIKNDTIRLIANLLQEFVDHFRGGPPPVHPLPRDDSV